MSLKTMNSSFASGLRYLDYLQSSGPSSGSAQLLNRRLEFGKSLHSKDLYAHYGCVNAVEFSADGEWLASGGDDKRVLLWNVDKALSLSQRPVSMVGEHNSNIFCLGFNATRSKLLSAGNDEQVILHDISSAGVADVFPHDEAVYCLSVDPLNESIFLSACDDGQVLMWDMRLTTGDPSVLASCSSPYHAVMHNPVEPTYVATGSAKDGVCLWDARKPRVAVMRYGFTKGAMSIRFNGAGTQLLALRRRLPPILLDVISGARIAEFEHPEYYNSCTMKSCCFAGDREQYVISGSDDFKLYAWRVPAAKKRPILVSKAHFVLRGHRSIVNQVRYNNSYGILASSGVEKIVKLWSSFQFPHNDVLDGYLSRNDQNRKVYTHEEYINLVLESGQFMTHDYSHHSIQEDPRMMAFFDSLVQRDIEGWTSDSVDSTDMLSTPVELPFADTLDSSESDNSAGDSERECIQTTEETDSSADRISQLIAKKRKEAKLKTAQATLHSFKKEGKTSAIDLSQSFPSAFCSHRDKDLNASPGPSFSKDKRKLFSKKRVKLSKNVCFDDSSSDSDQNIKSSSFIPCSKQEKKGNPAAFTQKKNSNEESQISCEQCKLSGDDETKNLSIADSVVAFVSKNGKIANRNYRKRSAQDRDDD